MREKINENRTVQLGLLVVLALAGGLLLLKAKGGGSESSAAEPVPSSDSGVAATAAPLDGSTPTTPTGSATAPSGASAQAAPSVPVSMLPGPGLPKSLRASYQRGNAVALLVVRGGGIDDALVRGSLGRLEEVSNLSVYVTKAKGIARYAWLTQGVNVTELPALVILRPKRLTKGVPTASVSYGFRDGASVLQAARDALYRGPTDLPYHP